MYLKLKHLGPPVHVELTDFTEFIFDLLQNCGGEGVKKFEIFMDVIDGSPLMYVGNFMLNKIKFQFG